MNRTDLLEQAIRMFGSQKALARATGYTEHGIWYAHKYGAVSPKLAAAIEWATQGKIPRDAICTRHDIFAATDPVDPQVKLRIALEREARVKEQRRQRENVVPS